tara:strand:+ start:8568 stop:8948 length:381 start_codon:yes stop_codon:yes gene_type:complete
MTLDKAAFLTPVPVDLVEFKIPELGGSIWIKGMTVTERSRFERQFRTRKGDTNERKMNEIRQRMLVACVCNADGQQLLTEADIEAIGKQRADIVERLVNAAQIACGMSTDDMEDIVKNSETIDESS